MVPGVGYKRDKSQESTDQWPTAHVVGTFSTPFILLVPVSKSTTETFQWNSAIVFFALDKSQLK